MQKPLIFGNSGSGKSTLALQLQAEFDLPMLDLDNITWEPEQPGTRTPMNQSIRALDQFAAQHSQWIIEGCYGELIEHVSKQCSELIFLDPGVEKCLFNNLSRPWEPHKYPSLEEQNKHFAFLQSWVKSYYSRTDECSHQYHMATYEAHTGKKRLVKT